ncbi:MAG: hypothetical protein M5U19_09405 [Microthrixaceae bacterium]|nr:hypothetical protein [Microthrixaceae bacterium]
MLPTVVAPAEGLWRVAEHPRWGEVWAFVDSGGPSRFIVCWAEAVEVAGSCGVTAPRGRIRRCTSRFSWGRFDGCAATAARTIWVGPGAWRSGCRPAGSWGRFVGI